MDSSFSAIAIEDTPSNVNTDAPPPKASAPAPAPKKESKFLFLFTMYFILAFPALGLLIAYKITDNPLLQPLNLDKDAIADYERGGVAKTSIFVHVNWGVDHPKSSTKNDLQNLVSSAMDNRTDNYVFRFRNVPGNKAEVTFVVGPNRYGPYPPAGMIRGIIPALAALELTERANR